VCRINSHILMNFKAAWVHYTNLTSKCFTNKKQMKKGYILLSNINEFKAVLRYSYVRYNKL